MGVTNRSWIRVNAWMNDDVKGINVSLNIHIIPSYCVHTSDRLVSRMLCIDHPRMRLIFATSIGYPLVCGPMGPDTKAVTYGQIPPDFGGSDGYGGYGE